MKIVKTIAVTAVLNLLLLQQALADSHGLTTLPPGDGFPVDSSFDVAVPEIDGSGAILAMGLVVGLVALFREKFR